MVTSPAEIFIVLSIAICVHGQGGRDMHVQNGRRGRIDLEDAQLKHDNVHQGKDRDPHLHGRYIVEFANSFGR